MIKTILLFTILSSANQICAMDSQNFKPVSIRTTCLNCNRVFEDEKEADKHIEACFKDKK